MVRPAPAARQLADRRPPGGLLARPGRGQVLAQGRAQAGRRRHRLAGRGAVDRRAASPTSCCPPTAGAPRPTSARRSRTSCPTRSRASRPGARSMRGQADEEAGRRAGRRWPTASRRSGRSRTRRLEIAEQQIRRDIPLWGRDAATPADGGRHVTREEIEASLADPDGAYRRLRRVMDAWCALWFWPLTEDEVAPPTLEQWNDALRMILGARHHEGQASPSKGDDTLAVRADLGRARRRRAQRPGLRRRHADRRTCSRRTRGCVVCERIAEQQGFFHWELDFAPVFAARRLRPPGRKPALGAAATRTSTRCSPRATRGGSSTVKPTQAEVSERRASDACSCPASRDLVVDGTADVVVHVGVRRVTAAVSRTWRASSRTSTAASWSRPGGTSPPAASSASSTPRPTSPTRRLALLRAATYRRLRRHWQFINELSLFEIHHLVTYGVHVYGAPRTSRDFLMATSLYHPDTVDAFARARRLGRRARAEGS